MAGGLSVIPRSIKIRRIDDAEMFTRNRGNQMCRSRRWKTGFRRFYGQALLYWYVAFLIDQCAAVREGACTRFGLFRSCFHNEPQLNDTLFVVVLCLFYKKTHDFWFKGCLMKKFKVKYSFLSMFILLYKAALLRKCILMNNIVCTTKNIINLHTLTKVI